MEQSQELSRGILTTGRLMRTYSGKRKAIAIDDTVNDTVIEIAHKNHEERELFKSALYNYRHATELKQSWDCFLFTSMAFEQRDIIIFHKYQKIFH